MSIKATPRTISDVAVFGTGNEFQMPNLPADTSTISYERVIQSVVLYNRQGSTINVRVLFGGRTLYNLDLRQNESFTVENLKFVQRADDNDNTKIKVEVLTTGATLGCNVVISYTDLQIPKSEIAITYP